MPNCEDRYRQELARRNRHLSILGAITTAASTSLDLREICDVLAHQLVEQLAFTSAFVFEYQEDREATRLIAIFPRDSLLLKAAEVLGVNLDDVVVPFRKGDNTVYDSLLRGEDWVGNDFAELTTPYVSAIPARIAQKLYGVKSLQNAPIMSKGRLVGTIVVGSARPAISEEERSIVLSVARQVAPSIENARLFARVKRESTYRASLVDITNAINSTVELGTLLDLIVKHVLQLTHSTHGGLFLIDEEDDTLRIKASRGLSDDTVRSLRFKKGDSIAGWVAQTGEGVLIHDVRSHPHFKQVAQIERLYSIITVPLQVEGKIVGVLGIDRFEGEAPFTEDEFSVAQDFANQASLALAKTKLFDELQQKNRRLQTLHELSVKLTGDTQVIFDRITTIIAELFDVPIATIEGLQENSLTVRSMFLNGEHVHGGVHSLRGTPCETVRDEKNTCTYTNAFIQFPDDRFLRDHRIRTYLGVPVRDCGGVVGVLNAMDHRVRSFTDEDRSLLSTFAERVHFELEEERRRKEREEMQRMLQASETKYRKLFEDVPAGVFQSTPDGKVIAANPTLVRMLGYNSETELRAVDIGEAVFVNPEARKRWGRELEEQDVLQNVELTLRRKDGQQLIVLENARVVRDEQDAVLHYQGTLIDITERRRAEDTLRESEARWQFAIEGAINGLWDWNAQTNEVFYSKQWKAMLGFGEHEIGNTLDEWDKRVHPDDKHRCYEDLERHFRGEAPIYHNEHRVRCKDGTYKCILDQGKVFSWTEEGRPLRVIGIHTDITERKRTEQALAKSEQRYRTLIEAAPDVIYTLDSDGTITSLNHAFETVTDWLCSDWVGRQFSALIHPDDLPVANAVFTTLMRGDRPQPYEVRVRVKRGEYKTAELTPTPLFDGLHIVGILGIGRDVTEKKRAEEELRRLANVVSQTADAVIITDSNGVIQYVNPAFEEISQYGPEEVIGRTPGILKSGKHEKKFYEELWGTILDGRVFRGQFINRKKNGDLYYEEKTITPVRDAEGNIVNFVSTGQDVTERKLFEGHLLQAHKLDSVGSLASGIAHDFNNILNNVIGFVTLIRKYAHDPTKVLRYSETIEKSALRGADLASQLLSFVRKKQPEKGSVDVAVVIDEICTLCRETFSKSITISTDIDVDLLPVRGSHGELYQVLLNLCLNARSAMPNGGSIAISACNRKVGEDVSPRLFSMPGQLCLELSVTDTGVGIPAAVRDKIFDPFFTTKEHGQGTGLGLSVVYSIVRNHGGKIIVESEEGEGATFRVYLPAGEIKKDAAAKAAGEERKEGDGRLVLLVDDEEPMRELGKELLEEEGYQVIAAGDGLEGLEIYKQRHADIALVVLDLGMPRMDGGQTFIAMKIINPFVKAFFCSGYTSDESIAKLLEEEHLKALQKPFNRDQFLGIVREILAGE